MRHTVRGQPNSDAHPVDLLLEFDYRFCVLRELAFAFICKAEMPECLEETFAYGINELYQDFGEVREAVTAWTDRERAEREAQVPQ